MLLPMIAACALVDRSPPEVDATWLDAHPVRDVATLSVQVDHPAGADAWVELGGERVAIEAGEVKVPVAGLPQGPQTLTVWGVDHTMWRHEARAAVEILVDTQPPILTVPAVAEGVGRTAVVWVDSDEPLVEPTLTVFGAERPLYAVEGRYRAMVGIGLRQEVGVAAREVEASDLAGTEVHHEGVLTVTEVAYPVKGKIRLTRAQVEARKDDEAKAKMRASRDGAYALQRDEQLWSGPFRAPLDPHRKTSPFGAYRAYSDGERSYHTGLDLTWRRGSPILAAAAGEVVVAELQAIHGNAVILHHGQGVTSSYSHLDRIDVAVGDRVEAGELLGIMGTTGQSTGPHLHFGVVVSGKAVDPEQWLQGL